MRLPAPTWGKRRVRGGGQQGMGEAQEGAVLAEHPGPKRGVQDGLVREHVADHGGGGPVERGDGSESIAGGRRELCQARANQPLQALAFREAGKLIQRSTIGRAAELERVEGISAR